MRKFVFIILIFTVAIYFLGCGEKQQVTEEMQEPISMEALSTMTTSAPTSGPSAPTSVAGAPVTTTATLKPLPPAGPYKPQASEIQTALKNAGYYTAEIDGKIGPKTKKAIEEFQKANGLEVDGKVGPKTWSLLSKYLNPQTTVPLTPTKKR